MIDAIFASGVMSRSYSKRCRRRASRTRGIRLAGSWPAGNGHQADVLPLIVCHRGAVAARCLSARTKARTDRYSTSGKVRRRAAAKPASKVMFKGPPSPHRKKKAPPPPPKRAVPHSRLLGLMIGFGAFPSVHGFSRLACPDPPSFELDCPLAARIAPHIVCRKLLYRE